MKSTSQSAQRVSDREFVISRVFDAPRERVFSAWVDSRRMAKWWGPKDFTNPVCDLDPRPGGSFHIVMRGPDGSEFPYRGVYREVTPPQRLVYTDDASEMPDSWHDVYDPGRDRSAPKPRLESVTTVTFEDVGGRTRMTVRTVFASVAVRDAMLKFQMQEGWSQSLDRLEALLAGA